MFIDRALNYNILNNDVTPNNINVCVFVINEYGINYGKYCGSKE